MTGAPNTDETLRLELEDVRRLLISDAELAAEKAARILASAPGHPGATLMLGIARSLAGDATGSIEILTPLARSEPDWALVHYELGRACSAAGRGEQAVAALRRAVELQPAQPGAWCSLADVLRAQGDDAGADAVCSDRIRLSARDPHLIEANAALHQNRIKEAEAILRRQLQEDPTDVAAMRMLAEVGIRLGQLEDAGMLLARCLELAPNYADARYTCAIVLDRQMRPAEALREIDRAMDAEPGNPGYRNLEAVLLGRLGEFDRGNEIYAGLLAEYPEQPRTWMSYGHSLLAAGRQTDSIAAYRKSIELSPELGEAWWSLANLKTFEFSAEEIDRLRRQPGRAGLSDEDRMHFEFALGKALEDAGDFPGSFAHYAEGNRLHRAKARYDASEITAHVRRSKALFTAAYFAERAGYGSPAPDPVFIVGLPRAGSTLLEQILASHPAVEGTGERPDVIAIVRDLAARRESPDGPTYPEVLAGLAPEEFRALGERYLASTRIQRRTDRPLFVDKMPNNFAHLGLIHTMLPNARIVDARRHPLACCVSNFRQLFARGQHFTYDLEDIGRYYRDYVELMAHFDEALPGRVHRVIYERLVDDTEAEVRRLLDYCGLPFDERCLRFHENDRAVGTASSEQVRQPVYRGGIDHWRHFEPWLEPLQQALGPVLEAWPAVPRFDPTGKD
jgi:tetratricopeptide (TPR) repeat protein